MESARRLVIAIDGPAASGKSTTAKAVAKRLGYLHIDTGAMYRAVTLKVMRSAIVLDDLAAIDSLLETTRVELHRDGENAHVLLDGEDVTVAIRNPEVTRRVSAVSKIRQVRDAMVREQRRMGADGGIVLEGRDIGTVVFPDADLKVFMVADIRERARRRMNELAGGEPAGSVESIAQEIQERDRLDSTRKESPLKQADDAVVLDTSHLSVEQQVEFVVARAKEIIGEEETA